MKKVKYQGNVYVLVAKQPIRATANKLFETEVDFDNWAGDVTNCKTTVKWQYTIKEGKSGFALSLEVPDQTLRVFGEKENEDGVMEDIEFEVAISSVQIRANDITIGFEIYPDKLEIYKGKTTLDFGW